MNKKYSLILVVILVLVASFFIFDAKEGDGDLPEIPVLSDIASSTIKEFVMTSFVEMVDGKPKPQYSIKEIVVNKGDIVRMKITVTSGMHDLKIDEYEVYADTKLNEESIVEFRADKSGEFIYYCTKPGHRQNGHWGTLIVLDK